MKLAISPDLRLPLVDYPAPGTVRASDVLFID